MSSYREPCAVCAADAQPGAPMCDRCWDRVPAVKKTAVNTAWKACTGRGFGKPDALRRYNAAVDEARRQARLTRPATKAAAAPKVAPPKQPRRS